MRGGHIYASTRPAQGAEREGWRVDMRPRTEGAGMEAWGVRGECLGQGDGAGGRGDAVLSRRSWKGACGNGPMAT